MMASLYLCRDWQLFFRLVHNNTGVNLFLPNTLHLIGKLFPRRCPGVGRGVGGGSLGGEKPTFMSVHKGSYHLLFLASVSLLCKLDRFVLLVWVLLSFMQKTVLLDEWLEVPGLSCGTRSFGCPPPNIPLSGPFPHLLLPVGPEPTPAGPAPPLWPAAALEGPPSLLESVSLKPPSPDPLALCLNVKLHIWRRRAQCQELG